MAFATADDVAARLGRELTIAEENLVEAVVEQVTDLIADAVGQDADWAADLDPVPAVLTAICVEKAIAVGSNPNGVASRSETLGSFSSSETFRKDSGLYLTPLEERLARRAVLGRLAGSSRPESTADEVHDLFYGS